MLSCDKSREANKISLAVEVLRRSGSIELSPRGYSMLPTLWPGDVVNVQAVPFDQIRPGQVILYHRDERFFIHRVVQLAEQAGCFGVITRGDSMSQCDAVVTAEECLGRVVAARTPRGKPISLEKPNRVLGKLLGSSNRIRSLALRCRALTEVSPDVCGQGLQS